MKLKSLKSLKRFTRFNLIDFAVPILDHMCPLKYSPNRKYSNRYYLTCLLHFVETSVSWRKYQGSPEFPINGKCLNYIHNKYIKAGAYAEIEKQLINKYLKTDREHKLKYQIIDSSFIANKGCSVNNNNHFLSFDEKNKNKVIRKLNKKLPKNKKIRERTFVDFNRYNGRKKYVNVSIICDSYGVPLTRDIFSSKRKDSTTVIEMVNKLPININTLKNSKINRYKQTFLGDCGYCSKRNRLFLDKKGYRTLIKFNKRNTKNKKLIKSMKFTKEQKQTFKRRGMVENFFSWIKNKPVINQNYQKTISSYNGLLSLSCIILISSRIGF
jgi:hypothetical protein